MRAGGAAAGSNRTVIIAIVLTVAATLYSLSELHRISAEHSAALDTVKFATEATQSKPVTIASSSTSRESYSWLEICLVRHARSLFGRLAQMR